MLCIRKILKVYENNKYIYAFLDVSTSSCENIFIDILNNMWPVSEGPSLSGSPSDNTLPVVFETTEDATLNNQSRADVNCDKTGTCYDGKFCTFTCIH